MNYEISIPEYAPYYKEGDDFETDLIVDFDSLNEMLLALDAGKIDIFELPLPVGKYLLRQGTTQINISR